MGVFLGYHFMIRIIFFVILFFSCLMTSVAQELKYSYPLSLEDNSIKLPDTDDEKLKDLLYGQNTIFYKLPGVWQHYNPPTKEFKKPIWNIYDIFKDPDSHANLNFPWDTTAGLSKTKKEPKFKDLYFTVNFINLPTTKSVVDPIWVLPERPIKWIYPSGTTVGEIIIVVNDSKNYIQEIRTRSKDINSEFWEPGLYRPIANQEEFVKLARIENYKPSMKYMFFRNPQEDEVHKMEGLVEELPNIPEETVIDLLSQKFKNVKHDQWSPTANQDFHILPREYSFSLISGIDPVACADCHRQTQISVRNLVPKDPDVIKNPDSIGNIRGSDGIFTWHPFAKSPSGSYIDGSIYFRDYDVANNLVVYTSTNPDPKKYQLTKSVQLSLFSHELPKNRSALSEIKNDN